MWVLTLWKGDVFVSMLSDPFVMGFESIITSITLISVGNACKKKTK